ncbi:MAG: hypothetical protein JOS17DRAFT_842095 [Linnemannia elongata]|nr:MAG: hypothetical protein JOS17DRAFT_842095 [Linnemannia elongata]
MQKREGTNNSRLGYLLRLPKGLMMFALAINVGSLSRCHPTQTAITPSFAFLFPSLTLPFILPLLSTPLPATFSYSIMSLFNVPELVDLVGTHLTSHDLTTCVLVNRSWYNLFTPRLWRAGLKPFTRTQRSYRGHPRHRSFCQMVRSDYLLATQRQQEYQEHHHEDDDLHNRLAWAGALKRNGRWIRKLNVSDIDFSCHSSSSTIPLPSETSLLPSLVTVDSPATAFVVSAPDPTNEELLSHLLRQCTNIQQLNLSGYISTPQSQVFWHNLIRTGLPTTTIIDLDLSITAKRHEVSFRPALLIQGSMALKKLTLQLYCEGRSYTPHFWGEEPGVRETKQKAENTEDDKVEEEGLLPSLRELSVTYDERFLHPRARKYPYPPVWPRLLRRCPNLESLYINTSDHSWIQALQVCVSLKSLEVEILESKPCRLLATTIKTYLPNLDTINICYEIPKLTDEDRALVISACQKGWRSIGIFNAGPLTVMAVVKHCSTLEVLNLRQARGLTSKVMVQILSSSPRLETFVTLVEDDYDDDMLINIEETHFLAEDFIDAATSTSTTTATISSVADPSSDPLRPWACESTLKVFRAKITGIPRPDIAQTYSGQPLEEVKYHPLIFRVPVWR